MASGPSIRPARESWYILPCDRLKLTPILEDPAGPTFLAYTPNGRKLITVGSNDTIRIFETGSSGEPINIDDAGDSNTAVVASVCLSISARTARTQN